MSRKDSTAALERRVRRVAVRRGLHILKAQKPDARVLQHGGYMLRDVETAKIVFGDQPYAFAADLDDIEAYLLKLDGGEDTAAD
jgi:hypothetical protein